MAPTVFCSFFQGGGEIVQFVSYEGVFDGPAAWLIPVDGSALTPGVYVARALIGAETAHGGVKRSGTG